MKRLALLAPLLAAAACTTDDLESFADGLSMAAYDLDARMNAPCPDGMYRQHVADTYPVAGYSAYPSYPYSQIGYQANPLGPGYSYCATLVTTYYDDDDHHHRRGHDRRDDDDDYRDGYRDGYRDAQRDE